MGVFYLVLAYAGFNQISDSTTNYGGDLHGGNLPDLLWGVFGVNTAINFIHALLGAGAIASGFLLDRSKVVAWCTIVAFALVSLYGLVTILIQEGTAPLAVTWGDNILHIATTLLLTAATVVAPASDRAPARA
ncbi:hypothetical protein GCM10029964_035380 [Kibdelosporangium lantanae]